MNWQLGYVPEPSNFNLKIDESIQIAPVIKFTGHYDSITRVKFSPDGTRLASVGCDGQLRVIDLITSRCIGAAVNLHSKGINDFSWDSMGNHIYSASSDGDISCVAVSQLPTHEHACKILPLSSPLKQGVITRVAHHTTTEDNTFNELYAAATAVSSPHFTGQYFVSGGYDEYIRQWDIRKFQTIADIRVHDGPIMSLDISKDDSLIVTSSLDGYMRIWETLDFTLLRTYRGMDDIPLAYAAFSPTARYLLCVPLEGNYRLWSLSEPEKFINLIPPLSSESSYFIDKKEDYSSLLSEDDNLHQNIVLNQPIDIQSPVEFLSSPGPCVFAAFWDRLALIPMVQSKLKQKDYVSGVGVWDTGTGEFLGQLSTNTHKNSNITCVSTRNEISNPGLFATASDFPDCSTTVWMAKRNNV